ARFTRGPARATDHEPIRCPRLTLRRQRRAALRVAPSAPSRASRGAVGASRASCRAASAWKVRAGGEHSVIPSSRSDAGHTWTLRGLLIVSVAALVPAIAGCEAGQNAPTQRWHQPTAGAFAVVNNNIRVNNLFVLGPAPGATLPPGASAGVFFALANNGAQDR